jgi:hypothetical protein
LRRAVAVLAAAGVLAGCGGTDCDEFAFDGEKWVTDQGDTRTDLAVGLVECDWLIGKTRREVRDGLGKPGGGRRARLWQYRLGPIGDMQSEVFELYVWFDGGGRVGDAQVLHPGGEPLAE